MFFSGLYYVFRSPAVEEEGEEEEEGGIDVKGMNNVSHNVKLKLDPQQSSSLGIVMINQMQIVTTVASSIKWSPKLPKWLVDMLTFLGTFISIDLSFFFASPECLGLTQSPVDKWEFAMSMPWCMVLLFLCWYVAARCHFARTGKYDAQVVRREVEKIAVVVEVEKIAVVEEVEKTRSFI